MEYPLRERVRALLKALNITQRDFERSIGAAVGYVNGLKNTIGNDKAMKLFEHYPNVSRDWLLFGEGEMLKSDSQPAEERPIKMPLGRTVPLLDVEAMAGYPSGLVDADLSEVRHIHSPVSDVDVAITTRGNSMEPTIPEGSIVFLQEVKFASELEYGKVHVLVTTEGVILKEIYPSSKRQFITIHSYNPRYPDREMPKEEILHIFRVRASMQRF